MKTHPTDPRPRFGRRAVLAAALAAALAGPAAAADAARSLSPAGSVAVRATPASQFKVLKEGDPVPAGELAVALPDSVIESATGAVRLTSRADFDGSSPFPIYETAVILHDPAEAKVDLDVSLDRGRIDLANAKKEGKALVQVRFRDEKWTLELFQPGTRVAVEIYARWAKGINFSKKPKPGEVPTANVVLIVLAGSAEVRTGSFDYVLTPPPGPALFSWDSVDGAHGRPAKLDKLPDWADPDANPAARKALPVLEEYHKLRAEKGVVGAIDAFVGSENELKRRAAIVSMGAHDELPKLVEVLGKTRDLATWNLAISVFRHWLGREPGQDLKMYQYLIQNGKYTPAHAEIVLQLLHNFDDTVLARPETYEVLISYLTHERTAVRNLAAWHLRRLVPAGAEIPFTPNASAEEMKAVQTKWAALIPPGKLPPRAVPERN